MTRNNEILGFAKKNYLVSGITLIGLISDPGCWAPIALWFPAGTPDSFSVLCSVECPPLTQFCLICFSKISVIQSVDENAVTGKSTWQMEKLFPFLTHCLFFLQLVILLSPSAFCCDMQYQKKHYFNNPILWHYWHIWILRPFMCLLILPSLLWYHSRSHLFSGSGCMWRTRTALHGQN